MNIETMKEAISAPVHTSEAAASFVRQALWNKGPDKKPFAVVECRSEQDIQDAIHFAADQGLGVSVLNGGNDATGRAAIDDGVVLDVRALSSVTYDPGRNTVEVGGGAKIVDLLQNLPSDQVAATGDVSFVGVAALTLGGGYSKLLSRFGLALDNLESARLVLADGSVVTASEKQEPDLFWALRGGGGNFGAVTSLTLKTHHVPAVLSAMLFLPLASAKAGILAIQEMLDGAPDSLSISFALGTLHGGERGLIIWPLWSGDRAEGEVYFDRLTGLPAASVLVRKWSSYADHFDLKAEKGWAGERSHSVTARSLRRLDEDAADRLLEAARATPSQGCWIIAHDFRGAATRIASEATAFPLRRNHFNLNIISGWVAPVEATPNLQWANNTMDSLSPIAIPGGYVALLGAEERPRVRDFYGEAIPRLSAVKARVDPGNLFRSNVGQL